MEKGAKVFIAGHNGMVGSAILRKLHANGFRNFALASSAELDLRDQSAVEKYFEAEKPDYVFLAAAKVGGIQANNLYRADFIYDNLSIQNNVIHNAWRQKVRKLLFLGSSCIYPRNAPQPIEESSLMSGALESTNEPYAIAKIAGIKMCQAYRSQYGSNFICAMPTNLYGPNDNYHPLNSHVMPALIRKFYEATVNGTGRVEIWGSGKPMREFLHVDDLADACIFLMNEYDEPEIVNVGTGVDLSIRDLAMLIAECFGFKGVLHFNTDQPDGTPRKVLDTRKINRLGWFPGKSLEEGVREVCMAFAAREAKTPELVRV